MPEEENKEIEDLKNDNLEAGEDPVNEDPTPTPPEDPPAKPWYQDGGLTFKTEDDAVKSYRELRKHDTEISQELALKERTLDMYGRFVRGELVLGEGETIESHVEAQNAKYIQDEKNRMQKLESDAKLIEQSIGVMKKLYPKIYTDDNLPILNVLAYQSDRDTPIERMEHAAEMYTEKFGHLSQEDRKKVVDKQEEMKREAEMEDPGSKGKMRKETVSAWDLSPEEFRKQAEKVRYQQ